MKDLIVFDSIQPLAVQNKCFDPALSAQGAGFFFWPALHQEAARHNMDCVTADIFLSGKAGSYGRAYCITEMYSPNTSKILKMGAVPAICYCLESPLIARTFYRNIKKYSGRFLHSFQFEGTRKRLEKTGTRFHTMYFPVYSKTIQKVIPWKEKKYLILINSNKRAAFINYTGIKSGIRSLASQLKFSALKLADPWMRIREIYIDRIQIIRYFSKYEDFFLYGKGWDQQTSHFDSKDQKVALKAWKGTLGTELETKLEAMRQFKFSICFENCNFPGYITEKIFDCFLAGCIPVYYGASDIKLSIPAETFIDYTRFKDIKALDDFLRNMKEAEARQYLNAAEKFLKSPAFDRFYVEHVTREMIAVIEKS